MLVKKHDITKQDVEIEVEKVTLLSKDEYLKNKSIITFFPHWWWLRSPGFLKSDAELVSTLGSLGGSFVNCDYTVVRPAMKIKSSNLFPGDKIETAGHTWTVLHDGIVLCDDSVGRSSFRDDWQAEDANDYEASDVKKWIEKWAVENGLVEKEG